MGTLLYGDKIEASIDDQSLFHLDVLLARLQGAAFQLHFTAGGRHDGDLVSLAVNAGVHLSLQYGNSPDLHLNVAVIDRAEMQIRNKSFVTLPFTFDNDLSEIGDI